MGSGLPCLQRRLSAADFASESKTIFNESAIYELGAACPQTLYGDSPTFGLELVFGLEKGTDPPASGKYSIAGGVLVEGETLLMSSLTASTANSEFCPDKEKNLFSINSM